MHNSFKPSPPVEDAHARGAAAPPKRIGRQPAAHVQAALAAAAQAKPAAGPRPAPAAHVQAAVSAARSMAPPAVQRAAQQAVQARPAVRAATGVLQPSGKSLGSGKTSSISKYTIPKGASIYHGTAMTKSVLASVMEDVSNLKTPAYFKTYASDYGTKVVVFRATEAIEVWDLGDTETVKALYKRMQESGDEDAVEALLYKSKSTNEYDLSAPASWRTVGKYDKVMHSWFASQGIRGWRMPFSSGDEIMLTTSAGLVCLGKLKQ